MTFTEFRETPELLKWARELTQSENFKLAIEAMKSIDPVQFTSDHDISPHYAHIQLGQQQGWAQYQRQFHLLALPIETREPLPEPDYPDEKPETEES